MFKTFITIIVAVMCVSFLVSQATLTPKEIVTSEENKGCVGDEVCVVFGETGDCNCGCYNKNHLPLDTGGKCFCAVPSSCRCINKECVGIFEEITNFDECVVAGYPIFESYPRQCKTPDGKTFVEIIGEILEKEQFCIDSGGKVSTSMCCKQTTDFPNLCFVGACGCSPDNSYQIKTCDCGPNKCFNGNQCILR